MKFGNTKVWKFREEPEKNENNTKIITLKEKTAIYMEEIERHKEIAKKYDEEFQVNDIEKKVEMFFDVINLTEDEKYNKESIIKGIDLYMELSTEENLTEEDIELFEALYEDKYIKDHEGSLKELDTGLKMVISLEGLEKRQRNRKIEAEAFNLYRDLLDKGLNESDEMLENLTKRFERIYKLKDLEEDIIENYSCGVPSFERLYCKDLITKDLKYDYDNSDVNLSILNTVNKLNYNFEL